MRSFSAAALGLAAASLVSAAPANRQFPLNDNFPHSNDNQIADIEVQAFGLLSNAPPPPTLSSDTFTSIKFVNFAEQIEAKFFDELIFNITHGAKGYTNIPNKEFTLATLKSMRATEELHTLNAVKALQHFGKDQIQPCQYKFPVSDFDGAIAFIGKVTSLVEGVLNNVCKRAAKNGDAAFCQGVIGTAENEAEQEGWFRFIQGQRPNEKPFHTQGQRDLAFSLQQDLVVPGSCPNAFEIPIQIIQPLNAADPPAKDTEITFTIDLEDTRHQPLPDFKVQSFPKASADQFTKKYSRNNWSGLFITYLNGQQVPASVPIKNPKLKGTTLTFNADFPFSKFDMFGLSIAALTDKANPTDEDDLFAHAVRGPALLVAQENFPADEVSNNNGVPV